MTTTPFTRTPGQPRDPSRIDIVLSALRAYWLANPDLRLGQIVVNAAGGGDPFSVEDEVLMAAWPAAPETPASDLAGLAAHYQTTAPPKPRARSCTACEKYIPGGAMWDCPGEAMIWAEDVANMESDATEWPDGVPACPAFRVRA